MKTLLMDGVLPSLLLEDALAPESLGLVFKFEIKAHSGDARHGMPGCPNSLLSPVKPYRGG